ncbi:hypothetical protein Tbis_0679 [Thermobispora bispora DSM 43833]|uniref:Uncharacterized protein n=1 Tax=Thermobispora bispora (strain ATCC 19993 / DSM 43833 / CBS 139.67 / JCM 10125 / KCTC 9307 / NBRC 14880 / R51) TaxID=469371 RepID=D6Y5Q8_THEBD|nr:hypothetical protein Tbis_0679 [Thermobispora bispora DSM 43833]
MTLLLPAPGGTAACRRAPAGPALPAGPAVPGAPARGAMILTRPVDIPGDHVPGGRDPVAGPPAGAGEGGGRTVMVPVRKMVP